MKNQNLVHFMTQVDVIKKQELDKIRLQQSKEKALIKRKDIAVEEVCKKIDDFLREYPKTKQKSYDFVIYLCGRGIGKDIDYGTFYDVHGIRGGSCIFLVKGHPYIHHNVATEIINKGFHNPDSIIRATDISSPVFDKDEQHNLVTPYLDLNRWYKKHETIKGIDEIVLSLTLDRLLTNVTNYFRYLSTDKRTHFTGAIDKKEIFIRQVPKNISEKYEKINGLFEKNASRGYVFRIDEKFDEGYYLNSFPLLRGSQIMDIVGWSECNKTYLKK